jgi:hypothetical protein
MDSSAPAAAAGVDVESVVGATPDPPHKKKAAGALYVMNMGSCIFMAGKHPLLQPIVHTAYYILHTAYCI